MTQINRKNLCAVVTGSFTLLRLDMLEFKIDFFCAVRVVIDWNFNEQLTEKSLCALVIQSQTAASCSGESSGVHCTNDCSERGKNFTSAFVAIFTPHVVSDSQSSLVFLQKLFHCETNVIKSLIRELPQAKQIKSSDINRFAAVNIPCIAHLLNVRFYPSKSDDVAEWKILSLKIPKIN